MILCSSGAFFQPSRRSAASDDPDVDAILTFGPQLPTDGVEVLVTRRMVGRLDAISTRLRQTPLRFPVVHAPKRVGAALPDPDAVEQLRESAGFAARLGAGVLVLHLWDLPDSDADMDGRLAAAKVAADIASDHGLVLTVETIPCHHATPLRNLERVLEHEPRVGVTVDTEFLACHNELDEAMSCDWLWDAVRHVHLKDYIDSLQGPDGRRRYLLPGNGRINFQKLFDSLEQRRFRGTVSLEAPAYLADGNPDVETLSRCLRRMTHTPWTFA